MKIRTLVACEDSSMVRIPCKDAVQTGPEIAADLKKLNPLTIGCRFKAMLGTEDGLFALVSRFPKNIVVDTYPEVAASLIDLGYAEAVEDAPTQ